ncbi:Holliday junction branch migration DNA helicase RuvB [Mycoplasmoides pirum]|uniref:Holliday junction branch migration DNA helicase RuvB n=1 Tax=Mycoplasmoides pirum TaxID=2122 RepID=UPI000566BFCA|nr:Holliday junction branch migration DNA helicase RuvB [Mycoplasmoides pirum]
MTNNYRPKNFKEFVGKDSLKTQLKTFIEAAKIKKQSLPHILFYGPPGVGKTTLANIIANSLNSKLKIIQATNIEKISELLNIFSLINKNDIIFIDEIHALDQKLIEFLFPIMEDFSVDVVIGKEFNSKITRMKIPEFTLIGATTYYGKIINPFEERFGIVINIDYYSLNEIKELIKNINNNLKLNLTDKEIEIISNNCKFTPRLAIRLIKQIYDYRIIHPKISIFKILKELNINDLGITNQDIQYLQTLKNNGTLGLKSLSLINNLDSQTIETKIEPPLIKLNLIEKTIKGRKISNIGLKYLEKINNN